MKWTPLGMLLYLYIYWLWWLHLLTYILNEQIYMRTQRYNLFFFNHNFIISWNMFCYLYRFHLNPSLNHVHTKLILKYFKNCENFTMNFYILINSIYIKSSKQLSFLVRWIKLQQPNRPSRKLQIKKLTWHAMKKSPVNFMIFLYYIYFKLS